MALFHRLRHHKGLFGVAMVMLGIAFVVTLPLTLPIALASHWRSQRKLAKLVLAFACVSCGKVLGAESLRLGDERWREIAAQRRSDSPGMRMRIVRTVHAVCPNCRREYLYREEAGVLETLAPNDAFMLSR